MGVVFDSQQPPPCARPLLGLGLALGLGSALAPLGSAGLLLAAGASAGLATALRMPLWIALCLPLSLAAARAHAPPDAPEGPATRWSLRAREGPWEVASFGRGRVAPGPGTPPLELSDDPWGPRARERVRVLAGLELRPEARGPEPAPAARGVPRARPYPDELVRLAPPSSPPGLAAPRRAWERLRSSLRARLSSAGPTTIPGLARALILGEREELEHEMVERFTRTGTRHLLAVSGLHVGVLGALLLTPLTQLLALGLRLLGTSVRSARWLSALPGLGLLLFFVPMAGGTAPVTRAALALALALCAPLIPANTRSLGGAGRSADGLSFWGLALSLECALDPGAGARLQVQLSYMATLGILLGAGPLSRLLLRPTHKEDAYLGRRAPLLAWSRTLATLCGRVLSSALAASLSAVIATLPVVWTRFGECAPTGVLVTLFALPPLCLCLLGATGTALAPGPIPAALLEAGGRWLAAVLRLADQLPGTPAPLPQRPALLLLLATALFFAALRSSRLRELTSRSAALGFGILLLPWSSAPEELELHLLDVGHGTAAVLRAPGAPAWIFDAGSRDRARIGPNTVAPLLRRWEVRRPVFALSHEDRDHTSGLEWLVERFPPRRWVGALPDAIAARLPPDCQRVDARTGEVKLLDQGELAIELLRGIEEPGNEGSRCLRVQWGAHALVLSGDAEGEGLAALLDGGGLDGPLALLSMPHHGSETPHLRALMETARPARVWISSGQRPQLAAELDRRSLDWSWTGQDGPLSLRIPAPTNGTPPGGGAPRPP